MQQSLSHIPRPQIDRLLDYIDFLHPGLKENTSNLSTILPSIIENGLPPQKIVLETCSSDQLEELYSRPLNELFEFCTGGDSQRPDAAAGLRLDHIRTADNSQSTSPSVRISSEDPSNGMADICEYTYLSTPLGKSDDPRETGQLSDTLVAPLGFSDIENAHLPDQFLPFSEQFDRYRSECFAVSTEPHSSIVCDCEDPPQDNTGLSEHLGDIPQGMDWPSKDQEVRTVNPVDLLLYSSL